jgi:hypothetical protein
MGRMRWWGEEKNELLEAEEEMEAEQSIVVPSYDGLMMAEENTAEGHGDVYRYNGNPHRAMRAA